MTVASPEPTVAEVARTADEELLESLGYKQEFRREFTGLEVSVRFTRVFLRDVVLCLGIVGKTMGWWHHDTTLS